MTEVTRGVVAEAKDILAQPELRMNNKPPLTVIVLANDSWSSMPTRIYALSGPIKTIRGKESYWRLERTRDAFPRTRQLDFPSVLPLLKEPTKPGPLWHSLSKYITFQPLCYHFGAFSKFVLDPCSEERTGSIPTTSPFCRASTSIRGPVKLLLPSTNHCTIETTSMMKNTTTQ